MDVPKKAGGLSDCTVLAGFVKIQNTDLNAALDSKRVPADAVDRSMKLIQWRVIPELLTEWMEELRVLLLGAGTLGCGVARVLLGWCVWKMTLVIPGRFLSTPVRQYFCTHADAAGGSRKLRQPPEPSRS